MSKCLSKYPKEVVAARAHDINTDMIRFLTIVAPVFDSLSGKSYAPYCTGEQDDSERQLHANAAAWKHSIRIGPPGYREWFYRMDCFIENNIPDKDAVKNRLWNALSGCKPFRIF